MNHAKAQQEILKKLLANPEVVHYAPFGDDHVIVNVDPATCHIIPVYFLRVDLTGAQTMGDWRDKILDLVKPSNRLTPTDHYRKGGAARQYLRADGSDGPYVDTGKLKRFELPVLYQDPRSALGMITVVEEDAVGYEKNVVGIVMPVNVKDETNETY